MNRREVHHEVHSVLTHYYKLYKQMIRQPSACSCGASEQHFLSTSRFERHVLTCSNKLRRLECPDCNKICKSGLELERHLWTHQTNPQHPQRDAEPPNIVFSESFLETRELLSTSHEYDFEENVEPNLRQQKWTEAKSHCVPFTDLQQLPVYNPFPINSHRGQLFNQSVSPATMNLSLTIQRLPLNTRDKDMLLTQIHAANDGEQPTSINSLPPSVYLLRNFVQETASNNLLCSLKEVQVFKNPDLFFYYVPVLELVHKNLLLNKELDRLLDFETKPKLVDGCRVFGRFAAGYRMQEILQEIPEAHKDCKVLALILNNDETQMTKFQT